MYVDYDPIVLAHARALLTSNQAGATDYIDADLRDTETILGQAPDCWTSPARWRSRCRDPARDPRPTTRTPSWPGSMDAVPSGSYLAIPHPGSDLLRPGNARLGLNGVATQMITSMDLAMRSHEQVARFFDGMDLVEPGLVRLTEWRPDPATGDAGEGTLWCAVARKGRTRGCMCGSLPTCGRHGSREFLCPTAVP